MADTQHKFNYIEEDTSHYINEFVEPIFYCSPKGNGNLALGSFFTTTDNTEGVGLMQAVPTHSCFRNHIISLDNYLYTDISGIPTPVVALERGCCPGAVDSGKGRKFCKLEIKESKTFTITRDATNGISINGQKFAEGLGYIPKMIGFVIVGGGGGGGGWGIDHSKKDKKGDTKLYLAGGGGGGGAIAAGILDFTKDSTFTVTIGAGGYAGGSQGNGGAGGASTIQGSTTYDKITANGGYGGYGGINDTHHAGSYGNGGSVSTSIIYDAIVSLRTVNGGHGGSGYNSSSGANESISAPGVSLRSFNFVDFTGVSNIEGTSNPIAVDIFNHAESANIIPNEGGNLGDAKVAGGNSYGTGVTVTSSGYSTAGSGGGGGSVFNNPTASKGADGIAIFYY